MVRDLLAGFVPGGWVARLDLDSLERVSGTYVSDDLRDREDDVIWRVRFRDDTWLYVYLLLEFQSQVDPFMALRILVYVGLLYQDLVRQKALLPGRLLPPVLPVVLYNGKARWTAATELSELVAAVPGLEQYQPRCTYLLLDEARHSQEGVRLPTNLVAALFELEHSRTPEEIGQVIDRLLTWLSEPSQQSTRRAFAVWLCRVLLPTRVGGQTVPQARELVEVRTMLAERVIEWTEEWKEEGLRRGRAEGRAEGRAQERERLLIQLATGRFGPLSEEQIEQLRIEDSETLLSRILTVKSFEDLVG